MRKVLIWCIVIIILVSTGYQFYLNKKINSTKNISPESTFAFKTSNPLNITIIGDSVAKGTGDEKGGGFSTYLPEYLKNKTSSNISVYNAGVNGLKSAGLLELLKDQEISNRISNSDIIVLSIGGNDILSLYSVSDDNKLSALRSTQAQYLSNLKDILKDIRSKNPYAKILFAGLYNPRQDLSAPLIDTLLNVWNKESGNIIKGDKNAVFINVNDIFKPNFKKYISPDGLHPNSAGYKAVSMAMADLK